MSAPFTIKFTDVWRDGKKSTRIESATLHGKPVVVIDPESLEQVARLNQAQDAEYARRGIDVEDCGGIDADVMQAALREFANPTPPKPEEPTGLGAVVEDADGKRWIRRAAVNYPWVLGLSTYAAWDQVPAVRILSEGVAS